MQIYGPNTIHAPHPIQRPHSAGLAKPGSVGSAEPIRDELQLSDAAQLLDQVGDVSDIRMDKVASIRAQIESGTYETPEKLEVAIDRLLDEIG